MRFDVVTPALIEKAIRAYLDVAWGDLAASHLPAIEYDSLDRDGVLEHFVDEKKTGQMRKFTLRLGNRRYPFMKIIFQELLVRDAFFFAVDTHDELDIKQTTPDYAEWLAIREYNANVKANVEKGWRELDVPTFDDVLEAIKTSDHAKPAAGAHGLVFVVDDDEAIANGVQLILEKRGFEVEVSHSAEEALEKLDRRKPDLVLSDLEMGSGYTGLQFCEKLRQRRGCEDMPFILATAAGIDLTRFNLIDGFLVKPYEIDVLVTFVTQHLK